MLTSLLLLAPTVPAPSFLDGEDWPGWRGPGGRGVAVGAAPPVEWSEEKNLRWKVALPGKGSSCPVVWGDTVYVTTAVSTGKKKEEEAAPEGEGEGEGQDRGRRGGFGGRGGRGGFGRGGPIEEQDFLVLAFARADGKLRWETSVGTAMPHAGTHPDGTYASPTLVTDGEHLIASFGSNGLHALTMKGETVWSKDLGDMQVMGSFGEGSSPVLHEGRVVLNWDHEGESFIAAFDKKSGDELWRTERPSGTSWSTPVVTRVGTRTEVIVGGKRTVAYDLENGKEVWGFEAEAAPQGEGESGARRSRFGRGGAGRSGSIASPVIAGGLLFVPGGGGLRALSAEGAEVWAETRDVPNIPSPVAAGGILYALKSNSGMLSAFDAATGERHYGPVRLEGVANAYASPVAAGGRLYITSRDGTIEVVEQGAEFESLAINTLDDGFDASPAIVGNEIFLRGRASLYCIVAEEE